MTDVNSDGTQIIQETVSLDEAARKDLKRSAITFTALALITGVPMFFGIVMATVAAVGSCDADLPKAYTVLSSLAMYGFPVFIVVSVIGVWLAAVMAHSKKMLLCFGFLPLISLLFSLLAVQSLGVFGCNRPPIGHPVKVINPEHSYACYLSGEPKIGRDTADYGDVNNVYVLEKPQHTSTFYWAGRKEIELPARAVLLSGAERKGFQDISTEKQCFGKDVNHVYSGTQIIEGANPDSFQPE